LSSALSIKIGVRPLHCTQITTIAFPAERMVHWTISPTVLLVREDQSTGRWGASVEARRGETFTSESMKLIEDFVRSNQRWGSIFNVAECWELLRDSDWGMKADSLLFLSKAVEERFRDLSAARIQRQNERPASDT